MNIEWINKERPTKLANIVKIIRKTHPEYTLEDLEKLLRSMKRTKAEWVVLTRAESVANWLTENMIE